MQSTLTPADWTRLDADHWAWPMCDSRGTIGRPILGPKMRDAEYTIADDGIGRSRPGETTGAGSGPLFHTAMLAVAGRTLGVSGRAGGGTQGVIDLRGD